VVPRVHKDEIELLKDEILRDTVGDEDQLWAFREAFELNVRLPCPATIVGAPVTVSRFDYKRNARLGLTATCLRANGKSYTVAASDIELADPIPQKYIEAYRRWIGISDPPTGAGRRRSTRPKAVSAPAPTTELRERTVEVAILSVAKRTARGKLVDTGEPVMLRSGLSWDVVAGEIAQIEVIQRGSNAAGVHLSGSLVSRRLDAAALDLIPLRLEPRGMWDPAEEFWGDPGQRIEAWAKRIIRRGRRPQFEMEQVLPGEDPEDPWSDPITESNDRKDVGDESGARRILMKLCRADLRCLDAHAHLGNLVFDFSAKDALRHYEAGFRIGELSLGKDFQGVLPWGMLDNRPFLRCLQGFGLCLWREERFKEAAAVFDRMLWLNPSDNQGARFLIDPVRARRPWTPEG
jgi:hypothetical protein